ncbi:tetratricopeptide repeat protein (macronuclear) [Tetrahymena thermophila SB210]|uniref:Tetratricopeptide repeat protein n=1 Tax=Tetrahymena thermophila (strain SB210) TaxID=312017 RepID=I7M089_TETTS|nr:tetratricopeptide repeat protein [Tetrahymena thermophila SB210]EAR85689.2 tetratricopeptide repeat protein [Tetrahymena thermophila SB210]|eukprot:XP_001033352.2 tetratricopeptide repeat protein [Tetrahymena thermophila SB210]
MISKITISALPKFLNLKLVNFNSQYLQQAQISQSIGHYSNAISYYKKFLQNSDCVDSRQIYTSHKFMADSFLKMNKVAQSHQNYLQALQELQSLPEKNLQEEVELLNKAAETCQDLQQALSYIERSMSLLNSLKNNNSLKMEALRVRAQILEKIGQKQEALNLCSQILLESDSLTSIDYKFAQKKRLTLQSLETFQEVSKELDQIIIQEHKQNSLDVPSAISDYYQISLKLWKKKEYFRSFQYVQRALQLAEVLRGSTHQDFYQCLDLIGQHLIIQGRLFEAQFYFERALSCVIQGKGPFHEDVIYYQKQLADLYVRQEKYQLAQSLYEQALQLEQNYYSLDHFSTLETNFKISLTELKQGKSINEVKENLEWMLKQFKKKNGVKNDKLQSQIVIELAKINLELNNLEDSKRQFQEFLLLEDNVDLMLDAYLNLGYIEMLQKNFDKANQIFERSKLFVQDKSNPKLQKIAEQQILVQKMQN